jgi:hypothetical protein
LLPEFGEQQRVLAALTEFGEVVFHAGLDPPAARLDTGALLLGVLFAHPRYRDICHQRILAGRRKLTEMFPDAGHDPALTGLDAGADLVEVFGTGSVRNALLCARPAWSQQEK